MTTWWAGLPSALATIDCGENTHRLLWNAGELTALDHDDIDGERTLAALAGERCPCADSIDAWARHSDDLRVLVLASRGPTDPVGVPNDPGPSQRHGPRPTPRVTSRRPTAGSWSFHISGPGGVGPAPTAPGDGEDELTALFGLGGALPERLFATVAATWQQRLHRGDHEVVGATAALQAALYGRVTATVRTWLGQPDLVVEVQMSDKSQRPTIARAGQIVQVAVPFAWLVNVWAKGFGTVAGRLCLAAGTADGLRWELSTVAPGLGATQPVIIDLPPRG